MPDPDDHHDNAVVVFVDEQHGRKFRAGERVTVASGRSSMTVSSGGMVSVSREDPWPYALTDHQIGWTTATGPHVRLSIQRYDNGEAQFDLETWIPGSGKWSLTCANITPEVAAEVIARLRAVLDAPSEPPEWEQVGWCDDADWTDTTKAIGRIWHKSKPEMDAVAVYRRVAPSEPEGPPSPTTSLPDPRNEPPTIEVTARGIEHSGCNYMALLFAGITDPDERVWFCNKCGWGGMLDASQAATAEMLRLTAHVLTASRPDVAPQPEDPHA